MRSGWTSLVAILTIAAPAAAADAARGAPLKVVQRGVTSLAAAAAAATIAPAEAEERRDSDREIKHRQAIQRLAAQRRSRMSAAVAAAQAATSIPNVRGLHLENEERAFGFKGLSNFDQAAVNAGFSSEPPDQAVCVGNGFVLEGVNSAFAVYSTGGSLLAGPASVNAFFDSPLNVSDPKCHYDAPTNRWFVTSTAYDDSFTTNFLFLAVSESGDPAGSYRVYRIDVSGDGSDFFPDDCPCLGDQPLIGANADAFFISTNAFGVLSFQGAQVYALSKAALVAGSSVFGVHFDQLSSLLPDVEFAASIQPAFSPPGARGEPGTEYLAQAMLGLRMEERLAVWTINGTGAIDSDPSRLSMSVAVIPSEVYAQPVAAAQKAGPTPLAERVATTFAAPGDAAEQLLDGNDQRLQQVMFSRGKLWTAVGTAVTSPGSPVRSAAAWFVIDVRNPPTGVQARVAAQGYVAGPDSSHLVYPAVAVNSRGNAVMVFTLAGPRSFPSAAYWRFGESEIELLARGESPQDGFSAYFFGRPRWGDYSGAAVDRDGSFWIATETIPDGPRKVFANWGTFVGRIHH